MAECGRWSGSLAGDRTARCIAELAPDWPEEEGGVGVGVGVDVGGVWCAAQTEEQRGRRMLQAL